MTAGRAPRELALGWRDALLARDAEAFGRLFAVDAVMVDVEHRTPDGRGARPLVGRPEIQAVAATWFREVGAFDYVVEEVLADDARAAVRWTYRVEASAGEPVELEGVSWLACRDGEIVRADVHFDVHALLLASGVRRSVDELLAEARAALLRLGPHEAFEAQQRGALLVDIRGDDQIRADGSIPGAIRIRRNVLEWRADPACDHRDPRIADLDAHLILVCQHGYQSSLAAATLQQLGFARATDLDGGFEAWQLAGLPVHLSDAT